MSLKLNILAFAAHPDDVEISAGGTILASIAQGLMVGIVDLTEGELGSRGSANLRKTEAANASKILGISTRENLKLADGFFEHNTKSTIAVIEMIRKYQPDIILCNAHTDRHPDHGRASKLVREAAYYAGLSKIETSHQGIVQEKWRPKSVYQYIQDSYLKPDFVLNITPFWDKKIAALNCFSSQFYDVNSTQDGTPISGPEFFDFLKGRALQMGRPAGFVLAEGFVAERVVGVQGLQDLL